MNPESEHPLPGLSRAATARILLVEDFVAFRQLICLRLWNSHNLRVIGHNLRVIGEASDGLGALQKAVELRPDLILLDIGLPRLNGIEVARQIRSLLPESKIIFLTRETSADTVQEALSVGAWGYLTKSKAQADLFAAVEAVLSGKTFISNLSAPNFPSKTHYCH